MGKILNKIYLMLIFLILSLISCNRHNDKIIENPDLSQEFSFFIEPTKDFKKVLEDYLEKHENDIGDDELLYTSFSNLKDTIFLLNINTAIYKYTVHNAYFYTKIHNVIIVFDIGFDSFFQPNNNIYNELILRKELHPFSPFAEFDDLSSKIDTIIIHDFINSD